MLESKTVPLSAEHRDWAFQVISDAWGSVRVFKGENGPGPVYVYQFRDSEVCLFHPGVGAPMSGISLEALIALGCRRFIAIGSCGVLDCDITVGKLIVPDAAVRDMGASYHYLPAVRESIPSVDMVKMIVDYFQAVGAFFVKGKTWTTDAPYRETVEKIKMQRGMFDLVVKILHAQVD